MKRGHLHFLGRKSASLFDTNVKMTEMDNIEFVLGSSATQESGTASVRARPTVKHHPSSDSFQGFAVPTPTVPVLPQLNGPKTNGSVAGNQMSNGLATSVPNLVEEEIFVPPPPSIAAPPPPSMSPPPLPISFIPPPPDFMGDLSSHDMAAPRLQSMPPTKPTFLPPSMEEQDLLLKPPPMAPPKPPSTCSSGSASSISSSSLPPIKVPEPPKCAPPQPPTGKQHKIPPPKPIRSSSTSSLDSPPQTPVPPPPVQTPTLSTFNPQNKAKLYNESKTTSLGGYKAHDPRSKQLLLLEDSGPVPAHVKVDEKAPEVATPPAPVPKDAPEIKKNVKMTQPSHIEAKTETVSAQSDVTKVPQTSPLQKATSTQVNPEKIPQTPLLQKATSTQVNPEKIPQTSPLQKATSTQVNPEKIPQTPLLQKATSTQVNPEKIPQTPLLQKATSTQVNPEKIPQTSLLQKATSTQVNPENIPQTPLLQQAMSTQVNPEKIPQTPLLQKATSTQVNPEKIPQTPLLQKATSTQVNPEKIPQTSLLQKATSTQVNPENIPQTSPLQQATSTQVNPEKIPDNPPLQKEKDIKLNSETNKDKLKESPSERRSFSPILGKKLRHLKANESSGGRESPAASPLALLMAAKEREKHKTTQSVSQEGSLIKNDEPNGSIHPSYSCPNSSNIPNSGPSSSLTPMEERLQESATSSRSIEHPNTIHTSEKASSTSSNIPAVSRISAASSPAASCPTEHKQSAEQSPSTSQAVQPDEQKGDNGLLLPPPPEFDDSEEITESPPSICPPAPPGKKATSSAVGPPVPATASVLAPVSAPPSVPALAPAPPPPPKLPPSEKDIKPKPQVQTKPKLDPTQLPPTLSPSQATLLSILQKKMLEMDHKMVPQKEAEPSSDDWGTALSEDNKVPVAARSTPQTKPDSVMNKTPTLDMRELENKVLKKYQENSQVKKFPTSNGPHSKTQHGKTFTIRPGTKQPITLVPKGD